MPANSPVASQGNSSPANSEPTHVDHDALSEHLALRGGLFVARCFASDLVEWRNNALA